MGKVFRTFTIFSVLITACIAVSAQDLGSSNKLFGADKKKSQKSSDPRPASKPGAAGKRTRRPVSRGKTTAPRQIRTGRDQPEIRTEKASTTSYRPMDPVTVAEYERLIAEGNAARDSRDLTAGEAAYTKARSLRIRDSRAPYGLGNLYADTHRWEDAERQYRDALAIDPDDTYIQLALSYVLTQPVAASDLSERYAEAERLARNVVAKRPDDPVAHDQFGVAREMLGFVGSETEQHYRRAIALSSAFAPAYAHLGRLLRRQGKTDESRQQYSAAIANATSVPLMILVADILQSEQRYADSLPLLRKAISADPRSPSALLLAANASIVTADLSIAESYLDRVITISPDCYYAHSLMGKLLTRRGDLARAESSLDRAAGSVTKFEKVRLASQFEAVGDAYLRAGDRQGARRVYKKALGFDPDRSSIVKKAAGQ